MLVLVGVDSGVRASRVRENNIVYLKMLILKLKSIQYF